jgi:hypothetical protein
MEFALTRRSCVLRHRGPTRVRRVTSDGPGWGTRGAAGAGTGGTEAGARSRVSGEEMGAKPNHGDRPPG